MKYKFTAVDEDDGTKVVLEGETTVWHEQADAFFRFLQAQDFILNERMVADHFLERANDVGNCRANIKG